MADPLSGLRVGSALEMADAVTRTTVSDGRVVGWYGDPSYVIDAEVTALPVPPALARRFGTEDFWPRWTRAECAAKLADVPIVMWLHDHGLTRGDAVVETLELGDLTVSIAAAARNAGVSTLNKAQAVHSASTIPRQ